MCSAYPNEKVTNDDKAKKMWWGFLKGEDYMTVAKNLEGHIKANRFPPTISELLKQNNKTRGQLTELDMKFIKQNQERERLTGKYLKGVRRSDEQIAEYKAKEGAFAQSKNKCLISQSRS